MNVGEPPTFTRIPKSRLRTAVGITIWFECEVAGYPTPTVTWLRDGEPIEMNGMCCDELMRQMMRKPIRDVLIYRRFSDRVYVVKNDLKIDAVKMNHSGIYQCFAENEFGVSSSAALLRIEVADKIIPTPVTNVRCNAYNSTAIYVTFEYTEDKDALPIPVSGGQDIFGDKSDINDEERPPIDAETVGHVFVVKAVPTGDFSTDTEQKNIAPM